VTAATSAEVAAEIDPALGVESPWRAANPTQRRRRNWLLGLVTLLFVGGLFRFGYPTGREVLTAWVLLFLLAACAGSVRVWSRVVLRDWLPLFAVLFLYDWLRGAADGIGAAIVSLPALRNGQTGAGGIDHAHVLPQLDADRVLFGGTVPTVWLQDHLYDPAHVHWYDALASAVYMSHFVVSLAVAVALWTRSYAVFRRYVWTLVALTLVTLLTYALFPAAPPWMASLNGYLPPGVDRIVTHTLSATGVDTVHALVTKGAAYANAVAAVPSLHGGIPMMLLLFAWPLIGPRRRALLALYPIAMLLTVVYTGEHYVSDVLLGWVYAAGAVTLVRRRLGVTHPAAPMGEMPG
jgi:hypothetical protein